jgi:hypothetical protein
VGRRAARDGGARARAAAAGARPADRGRERIAMVLGDIADALERLVAEVLD